MKALALALAVVAGACSNSSSASPDGGPGSGSGSGSGSEQPGETFTSFVIELVTNQTTDDAAPVAYDRFATLPDPDADSNNTSAYAGLF
ncbi:MAG TPA: hypothetical protein VGD37_25370 [Kofleriaceae bacterium]